MPTDWMADLLNEICGDDENVIGVDTIDFTGDAITFIEIRRVGEDGTFAIVERDDEE